MNKALGKYPYLETERLILRLPPPHEAPAVVRFLKANRAHFAPWDPLRPPEFYRETYWENQLYLARENFLGGRSMRLFLFQKSDGAIVGAAHFNNFIRGVFHSCLLGYQLAAAVEGKGLMLEALNTAIPYVFNTLNLHRIEASYMPRNVRSGKLLERLGFTLYGEEDNYLRINGKWEAHIHASLYNPDWREEEI